MEWSSGSFFISPGSQTVCLPRPSNPQERGGKTGTGLSSWRLKGEAHIWLVLSHPGLGGSTHCIFVPRQPHHPPVT